MNLVLEISKIDAKISARGRDVLLKRIIVSLILATTFGLIIGLTFNWGIGRGNLSNNHVTEADMNTTATANEAPDISNNKPSPTIGKVLTFYPNDGFRLQPDQQVSLYKDGPTKTIHTVPAEGELKDDYALKSKQWTVYDPTTKKWDVLGSADPYAKVVNNDDLVVSPNDGGTRYYQYHLRWTDSDYWGVVIHNKDDYSNIVKVNTYDQSNKTSYLSVKADDNFLYNNQNYEDSTYVHAIPKEENATGSVKWTSSDNTIATVDQQGLVRPIADPTGKTSTVTIYAEMTNPDGTVVKGNTDITVGGGLSNQKVKDDSSATFTIQGSRQPDMSSISSINWYRIDPPSTGNSSTPRLVATGKNLQFSVNNTRLKTDNGAQYYAVVTFNGEQHKQITTNKALLSVYSLQNNEIRFHNFSVENYTHPNDADTDTLLHDVSSTDEISMQFILQDSLLGSHDKGPLVIQLPAGARVTMAYSSSSSSQFDSYIDSNGKKVYKTQSTDNPEINTITDKNSEFDGAGATLYLLNFYLPKNNPAMNFTGNLYYSPASVTGVEYGTYVGPSYTINPIPEEFQLTAQSIDFGDVLPPSKKPLIGKVNDPNSMVLQVVDKRSFDDRTPRKVFVSADPNFMNENGKLFNSDLILDNNGVEEPINLNGLQIYQTKAGEAVPSIYWKDKLKLKLPDQTPESGKYKTTLTWTVSDTI